MCVFLFKSKEGNTKLFITTNKKQIFQGQETFLLFCKCHVNTKAQDKNDLHMIDIHNTSFCCYKIIINEK